MQLVTLHIDGTVGAHGTQVLAGSTADTLLLVHHRNHMDSAHIEGIIDDPEAYMDGVMSFLDSAI